MKYTSKYIEEILTSPSAKRGLDYITPIYQEAQNALWIMQAMGLQTDIIIKWIQEYIEQVLPQTATWLLPYFEKEYGIPVNKELTIDERRKNILLAIRTRAPMNPVKLAGILSLAINIDNINIKENTGKNTFSVEFSDVINKEQINKVTEILNKYKPAHLIYWFNSIIKIQLQNKNNIFINKLIISSYFNNLELKIIYLNGKENLDGTWNLQAKTKSIELSKLIISGFIDNIQKNNIGIVKFLLYLKNNIKENKLLLNSRFNYLLDNRVNKKAENKHLIINSSFNEKENIQAYLTLDTMWRLDGTYNIDGTRKLNARTIRITL